VEVRRSGRRAGRGKLSLPRGGLAQSAAADPVNPKTKPCKRQNQPSPVARRHKSKFVSWLSQFNLECTRSHVVRNTRASEAPSAAPNEGKRGQKKNKKDKRNWRRSSGSEQQRVAGIDPLSGKRF